MATGTYIPIEGIADSSGRVLALKGLVSNESLLVPPKSKWTPAGGDAVQVKAFSATAELMASVGFRGLAISGGSKVAYWVMDVLATTEAPSTSASSPIASWVYGVGLRLGIRGISVSGTAAFSISNLAASATLEGTSTSFQFDTVGIGSPAMPFLGGLVDQSLSGFDVSTLQEVGNVVSDLTAFIANSDNSKSLTPQVVGVIFATGTQIQASAASCGWALRGIEKGMSAKTLATKSPSKLPPGVAIDSAVVSAVYEDIVGSLEANPTREQQSIAKELTHSGP